MGSVISCSPEEDSNKEKNVQVADSVKTEKSILTIHPRILLLEGEEKTLFQQIVKNPVWNDVHKILINEANAILPLAVKERVLTGKRLLSVSQENLRRVFILSYAYRMTLQTQYSARAEKEMLKMASFSDWNPSHFLDVAEMTTAMAIGYDWCYSQLSNSSRSIIENAIIEKGLKPSFNSKYNWFLTAYNNWNQVCNGGMTYGALAIYDKSPELAKQVIDRAVKSIVLPMSHYAPDGAYPEGPGYWNYGTTYNVLFLTALEKVFGTDYGLSQTNGFMKTANYVLNTVSPNLRSFNYSDNGASSSFEPGLFWFYYKQKDPSILYNQIVLYKKKGFSSIKSDRFAPAMLIWGVSASMTTLIKPLSSFYLANGDNPICVMRSSWDENTDTYLGVKAGSPSVNHAHMDVGSFMFESNTIDWSLDMGAENYTNIEAANVNLWSMAQNSDRWKLLRYNNSAHSTLSFNNQWQVVSGKATIIDSYNQSDSMSVTLDLTPVYKDQVNSVKRKVSLINKKIASIEDEISSNNDSTSMRWNLTTSAIATVLSSNLLLLEKDGKAMYMKVDCVQPIKFYVNDAQPTTSYESKNNGISLVGFTTVLKKGSTQKIAVRFTPKD